MRRFLVLWPILFLFATNMAAEKPFDFASTPGKLPKDVAPTDYAVRIEPNVDKLTFTGLETAWHTAPISRAPIRGPASR